LCIPSETHKISSVSTVASFLFEFKEESII
jgi:hypothetical protein